MSVVSEPVHYEHKPVQQTTPPAGIIPSHSNWSHRQQMEMTRRQFALSVAAGTSLPSTLFEPTSPVGVPRGVVPGRVTWAHDPAAVTWDGTGSWWQDAN